MGYERDVQLNDTLDHRDRVNRVLGMGGGVAKGYKSNKAVYKIVEKSAKRKNKKPLVKIPWSLKFFGDDSPQFWSDLDKEIAGGLLVSELDIVQREPIHHNLSLSFSGVERFLRDFPEIRKGFENEEALKDYILDVIVWYLLPVPYPVNKGLLYQSREPGIEPEKRARVTFSVSEDSVRDLVEIYRTKVGVPSCDFKKINGGTYRIDFAFSRNLFERYNYLEIKPNPSIRELGDEKNNLMEPLKNNIVVSYYLQNRIIDHDDLSQRYDEIVEELTSDLPSMSNSFNKLKNDVQRMFDVAGDVGSVSLILSPNASNVTTVELHVSQETKQKLLSVGRLCSYMENYWHVLQPSELLPIVHEYGKDYLQKVW